MYLMRFDLRAPGCNAEERSARFRAAINMASFADEHRCTSIVISEHHVSDDGYLPSPLTLAAAMAAVTRNTPIVVAAALLALYDPVRFAEDLITLDYLSQGRVMIVFGVGYRPIEYELHGVDYDRRGSVADEKLERLLEVLRTADTGTDRLRVTPAPYSSPMPLLAWGGRSKAAARRAGRHGIGFFAQTDAPGLGEVYAEAARANGHEPGLCILPSPETPWIVFVNDDVDAGWREVGPSMLVDAVGYHEWNAKTGETDRIASLSSESTVEALREANGSHRVVSVDGAVDLIHEHGTLGLHPLCGGLDPEVAWPYLRRAVAAAEQAMDAPKPA